MQALGRDDDVLCCTAVGSATLRDYCEAAGAAGFSAVSVAAHDYKNARRSGLSDADIRSLFADNGLRVAELECIFDWIKPLPYGQGAGFSLDLPIFGHAQADFFAIGEAIGATSATVADPFPSREPLDKMVEAFAVICDHAAGHGMRINLEFLSWDPVPDLATAWDIVRAADRANGGLTIDTTHLVRSGSRDLLRSIPGEKIFTTQFADGWIPRREDAFADAANRVMLCDGEFGLASIFNDLRATGSAAPSGFEVINPELSALPATGIARIAKDALRRLRAAAAAIE